MTKQKKPTYQDYINEGGGPGLSGLKWNDTGEPVEALGSVGNINLSQKTQAKQISESPWTRNISDVYGQTDFGNSIYDKEIDSASQLENLEDTRANIQPFIDKAAVGIGTFLAKTATATAGGIGNIFYGTISAIADQRLRSFYDNALMNGLQEVNEDIDGALKIYQSDSERNGDFWDQTLGSYHFWLKGVLGDGMSFTAGAVLSAYALGGIGNLASIGAKGIGLANLGNKVASGAGHVLGAVGKNSDKISKVANALKSATAVVDGATDASMLTNIANYGRITNAAKSLVDMPLKLASGAGYESGIEALGFIKEAKENKANELMQKYGELDTPEKQFAFDSEMKEFDKNIEGTANAAFGLNMALVGASNIITLPTIFGKGVKSSFEGAREFLRQSAEGGVEYVAKEGLKGALKTTSHLIKPAIMEGLVEEGGQGFVNKMALDYVSKQYDLDSAKTQYDFATSLGESFQKSYGSVDGWKEIMAGMIIGSTGAVNFKTATKEDENGEQVKVKKKLFSKNAEESWWIGGVVGNFQEENADRLKAQHLADSQVSPEEVWADIKKSSPNSLDVTKNNITGFQQQYSSKKEIDNSIATGDFVTAKNAEHDVLHSYVKNRVDSGFENSIEDDLLNPIQNMDAKTFSETFGYETETNEDNVEARKKEVIKATKDRISKIKSAIKIADSQINFDTSTDDGRNRRDMFIYALSTIDNVAERINAIKNSVTEKLSDKVNPYVFNEQSHDESVKLNKEALEQAKNDLKLATEESEKQRLSKKISDLEYVIRNSTVVKLNEIENEKTSKSFSIPNTVAGVANTYNFLVKNLKLIEDKDSGMLTANPSMGSREFKAVNEAMRDLYDLVPLMRRKEEAFELYKTSTDEKAYKNFKNTSRLRNRLLEFKEGLIKHHEAEIKKSVDEAKKMADKGANPETIEAQTGVHPDKISAIFAEKEAIMAMNFEGGIKAIRERLNKIINPDGKSTNLTIQNKEELFELLNEMLNDENPENDVVAKFVLDELKSLNVKSKKASEEVRLQPSKAPETQSKEGISDQFTDTPSDSSQQTNEELIEEVDDKNESKKLRDAFNKLAYLAINYTKKLVKGKSGKSFFVFTDKGLNSKASRQALDFRVLKAGSKVKLVIDNEYRGDIETADGLYIPWEEYRGNLPAGIRFEDVVPIKVVFNGETIGYLHDINFMREGKIVKEYEVDGQMIDNIEPQRQLISAYRKQVIDSGGQLDTTIKFTGFGKLIKNKGENGENVQLSTREAFPNKEVEISITHDKKIQSKKNIANEFKNYSGPIAIIPVTELADGNVMHIAVPISPKRIDAQQAKLLSEVTDLFVKNILPDVIITEEKARFNDIAEKINKALSKNDINGNANFNIKTLEGLRNFMALFIHPKQFNNFSTIDTKNDSDAVNFAFEYVKDKNGEHTFLIGIGPANNMTIYKVATFTDYKNEETKTITIGKTTRTISQPKVGVRIFSKSNDDGDFVPEPNMSLGDLMFTTGSNFNSMLFNANRKLVGQKVSIPSVDENNNVVFSQTKDYSEVIAENTTTNLLGINIGTDEKPNYIYAAQRTIELDENKPVVKEDKIEPEVANVDVKSKPTIDTKFKKADIEKIRAFHLSSISDNGENHPFAQHFDTQWTIRDSGYDYFSGKTIEEVTDKINAKYDAELDVLEQQKSEVQSDKPKRDRKSKPRVDYSKSEDEDLSFDTESNQPEVKTAEEKAKDDLVKPTSNLESSTGEFMKESSDWVRAGVRKNINELNPKCK